jgi:hypothetical protein
MITAYDLTEFSAVRRERLRKALELNRSYYGYDIGIRVVTVGKYCDEQKCWNFTFVDENGHQGNYIIFESCLLRDMKYVIANEPSEVTAPEEIVETIKTTIKKNNRYFWTWRSKNKPTVFNVRVINKKGFDCHWVFVQYRDKVTLACQYVNNIRIEIGTEITTINHALFVAKKILREALVTEPQKVRGGKKYA